MNRSCLAIIAGMVPRNRGKAYPQLWYCMPSIYKREKERFFCCVCHEEIKGTPPMGKNDPLTMPAPQYWCHKCLQPGTMLEEVESMIMQPNTRVSGISATHAIKMEGKVDDRRPIKWRKTWRAFLQWLCGKLTGHELSKTEWGYGGGSMVDGNCRWCDHRMQMPMAENPATHPALRGLTRDYFGRDPESGKPLEGEHGQ